MGKIESLQKLNELKEKGTITDTEFQLEKAKILNDDTDINDEAFEKKEKNQKKPSKIMWIVLLIIIVIPVGIVAVPNIMTNKDINEMERKLSEIDAEELQEKIIEKLSPVTLFFTSDDLLVSTEVLDTLEETDNFVTAIISFTWMDNFPDTCKTAIPCFKIKSDSKGKFQTIEYISGTDWFCEDIIQEAIVNVFKESYNIDMHLVGEDREKYCSKFLGFDHKPEVKGKSMEVKFTDYREALLAMAQLIENNNPRITDEDYAYDLASQALEKEATTTIWGRLDS